MPPTSKTTGISYELFVSSENLYFPGPWDHSNAVQIKQSSKLPQKLSQFIDHCSKTELQTL